jgi:hypothetical protein
VNVGQVLGSLLQVAGTLIAGWALVGLHRRYGDGDLVPAWSRSLRWAGRLLRRRRGARITGGGGLGTWGFTVSGTGRAYAPVPENPSTEDLAAWLQKRMVQVQEELDEVRAAVTETRSHLGHRIAAVETEARNTSAELRTQLGKAMTDRIQAELFGLFLVVVGTFVSALAT